MSQENRQHRWDEQILIVSGGKFKLSSKVTLREISDANVRLQGYGELFMLLKTAKIEFGAGRAVYDDCFRNAANLLGGLGQAQEQTDRVLSDIGTFFEPILDFQMSVPRNKQMQIAVDTLERLAITAKLREEAQKAAQPPVKPKTQEPART